MSQQQIDNLIATIDNIPPLPEISAAVMTALNAQEIDIVAVSDLIEKDIALSSQILKVANSPAYGVRNSISNIKHAIMMLGLYEVRTLLLAFAVEKFFTTGAKNTALRQRYWAHSRVCSYAALLLTHHFKQGDTAGFFLSGLIHDIGKLIIDQFLHEEFEQIVAYIGEHNCSFTEAEKEILGFTHSQVGAKLLQHWHFPRQVAKQVLNHHLPWQEKEFTAGAMVIFLANLLTKIAGHGCLAEETVYTLDEFRQSKEMGFLEQNGFGLDDAALHTFLIQIEEFVAADAT